jgi:hypothetical protein
MKTAILAAFSVFCASCVGTTGGDIVDFQAAAAGPTDAVTGQPLSFETGRGWHVELNTARMHVGALYLSDHSPPSGAQSSSCILPGSYVAQVIEGRDIDLLSSKPQLFPVLGHGTTVEPAQSAQVWLTGGDINDPDDPPEPTAVLELSGTARQGNVNRAFAAKLTIANNRITTGGASAGADTICVERIVSPIPLALQVQTEGALLLRIDPRMLFTNVDFGALSAENSDGSYAFVDSHDATDQPSINLYNNLKQAGPLYALSWVKSLH